MDDKYQFVCRVCLVKDPSSVMRSLADEKTRQSLIECTSVSVSLKDESLTIANSTGIGL